MTWSTVVVADTVLLLELLPGYGIPLYITDPGGHCEFRNARWRKGLRFPTQQWVHAIAAHGVPCTPVLGRVFHFDELDVTWRRGPRDPEVLHQHHARLAALATALTVKVADLGVCGSALYKTPDHRGDFDFVVFEREPRSPAWAAVCRLAGGCQIDGIPYHLRFRLPGHDGWHDPHFTAPCALSDAIVTGQAQPIGTARLNGHVVTQAAHGHHAPAHYQLDTGHDLVSFRFGHSGLFHVGDRLTTANALPLVTWHGMASFVVSNGDQHVEVWRQ